MRVFVEASAFVALAFGAHVLFVPVTARDGLQGAGSEGQDLLSVRASTASVAQMVRAWQRPVEVQVTAMPTLSPVSSAEAAPHAMTAPSPVQAKIAPAAPMIQTPQGPSIETSVDTSPARPTPPSVSASSPAPTAQKKPQTNTVAQTARKAAGQGGKAAKGKNGTEENASANAAKTASLARKWGSRIHARISQRAPKGAGKGKAVVAVTVARSGQVLSVSLSRSSGNATLDRLAVRAVKQAGRMPAAPKGFEAPRHTFHIPIRAR